MLDIPVMVGSTRRGRNTPRLARLLHRKLLEDSRVTSDLLDLGALQLPILEERYRFLETPPAALGELCGKLERSDALVVVSPEYNKACPAVLKNVIDALGDELRRKPVGIAAHSVGAFGGQVVLQQLRPMFMNLGAAPIPGGMTVPHITRAIDEKGGALEPEHDDRAGRFLEELIWYAEALRAQRQSGG